MPKKASIKHILTACHMSFDGKSNREISDELGFTEATVCAWRNTEMWKEFEEQLIDAYKQQVLRTDYGSEAVTPPLDKR